jgi:hypothetical protein
MTVTRYRPTRRDILSLAGSAAAFGLIGCGKSTSNASSLRFTSQWFFDESITDIVHAQTPYRGKGRRDTLNSSDGIYGGGGSQFVLALTPEGSGYGGTFDIGLQL